MPALRVAIDLTTLQPCARQAPATSLPVRFTEAFTQQAQGTTFAVLVRPENRAPLAHLQAANTRLIVAQPSPTGSVLERFETRLRRRFRPTAIADSLHKLKTRHPWLSRWRQGLLASLEVNVVFCPFTSSGYSDPSVPLVVAVSDLQHLSHPYLLGAGERTSRAQTSTSTCRRAARIVCSAPSLRAVALQEGVAPERLVTVAPGRLLAQPAPTPAAVAATLARQALTHNGFVLLVGDFEPRHNHRVVLTALSILRARRPDTKIRLVCVGGPESAVASFRTVADRMGLGACVQFAGPLGREDTSALIQASHAVLVPPLYETVGETLLEAMQRGRPVVCSQIPGLAELTDSVALKFDPHRPADLAAALESVERDPAHASTLAQLGMHRAAASDDARGVAEAYLGVLREALTT